MGTTSNLTSTQKRIIEAAVKIFSEKGFEGATTSEIAQEAGVAEGTIFRHFGTKKGILQSILLRAVDSFQEPDLVVSLARMIEQKRDEAGFYFLMDQIGDQLHTIQQHLPMLKLLFYEAQFHAEIKETMLKRIARPIIDLLSDSIRQKQSLGDYRELDADLMALSLLSSLWCYLIWKQITPDRRDGEKELVQVLDIWLKGVTVNSHNCREV
jgi:AcrR family transcriptional regulator